MYFGQILVAERTALKAIVVLLMRKISVAILESRALIALQVNRERNNEYPLLNVEFFLRFTLYILISIGCW